MDKVSVHQDQTSASPRETNYKNPRFFFFLSVCNPNPIHKLITHIKQKFSSDIQEFIYQFMYKPKKKKKNYWLIKFSELSPPKSLGVSGLSWWIFQCHKGNRCCMQRTQLHCWTPRESLVHQFLLYLRSSVQTLVSASLFLNTRCLLHSNPPNTENPTIISIPSSK